MKTKLNMGCGFTKFDDHHNVDYTTICNPDEVVDLESLPWPWEDNSFDEIYAKDILEHLGQNPREFIAIIKEMYRVSRPMAIWKVIVPHWRCDIAITDPTHVRLITDKTFHLFDQKSNADTFKKQLSESMLGVQTGIDLETVAVDFDILDMWKQQLAAGMIGARELDKNLNHMNNIAQTTIVTLKVHKPGRFEDWYKKFS